jgi:signal transduction histidine kinase
VSGEEVDGRAVVRVADNGLGVPPELREEVFVLFRRAHNGAGGHGIGLATTRRVIEAHRGRIAIEASEPPGTTVVFDLPLA